MTLDPLYRAVAWVIVQIHAGLSYIFPADSGWAWGLSIILLTVLVRILIFPLFVKQIRTSQKMQVLNPQIQALRKKYKNDKQRLNQEVMKLYQESGANPLAGCLPLVLQLPIFLSLFRVLNGIATARPGNGSHGISPKLVTSAQNASIFGAKISSKFLEAFQNHHVSAMIVTGIVVAISSVTTYFTIKSSMARSATTMTSDNPMMQSQRILVYIAPFFGLFGLGFPLGVLLYWVTSNSWTLAQQHFIYKRYPQATPGTPGDGNGGGSGPKSGDEPSGPSGLLGRLMKQAEPAQQAEPLPQLIRQQPVRQPRSKRGGARKR